MIVNASLLRIDTRGMPDATGAESWTAGEALSIDCCVTEPSRAQKWQLGATISDATVAVFVLLADLGESAINVGDKLVVQQDGQTAVTVQVVHRLLPVHNDQTHVLAFCKEVAG